MAYRFQKMTNSVLLSVALLFSFSVQHLSAESLVNIPDPFARKIISEANNLAGETLGTENVVSRENGFAADGQPESALTQFDLREYRLVAVSTRPTNDPSRAIIDATSAGATSATTFLPTMNFARLGQFATISLARQFAVDLYAAGQSLIYGNIIIRNNGGQFIVDIGPVKSPDHAAAYCHMLRMKANAVVSDCVPSRDRPVREKITIAGSLARLDVALKDANGVPTARSRSITISEGDQLGASNMMIVKITPSMLLLSDMIGNLSEISITSLLGAALPQNTASTAVQ